MTDKPGYNQFTGAEIVPWDESPRFSVDTLMTRAKVDEYSQGEALENQLHTARYAFHMVRKKVYGDAVHAGLLTVEQATEHYNNAMANYDSLIAEAGAGHAREANQRSMDEGFLL